MSSASYERRVHNELQSYREIRPELAIPGIFTYWASRYLSPRLRDIMGTPVIEEYFATHLGRFMAGQPAAAVASLGCGDCGTEIDVARRLQQSGLGDFVFDCYDISPHVLGRAAASAETAGVRERFRFIEQDLNHWHPESRYRAVMANHSLHHFVGLEHLFDAVHASLHDEGGFVVSDMIGRNGHQRWPEALEIVNALWPFLPDKLKYNHLLKRHEPQYENWDCSAEAFEGIRAQDILPLLIERFGFERFVAFGNLPDIFVERTFGPNFDPADAKDLAVIDFLEMLNTLLIQHGQLKPTQMFAVLVKGEAETLCDRGWTPEFCVRRP